MANSHKISGSALIALKEALTNIYWIKNDLKMFVNHTINNKSFVSTLDMTKYKREIANVFRSVEQPKTIRNIQA